MSESGDKERIRDRIDQVLDVLAHLSFGNFDVAVPEVPDDDEFADVFIGLQLLVGDLSEDREDLEEQIRERTREIEESVRDRERAQLRAQQLESLGTLAGGIAHDFNNCLTAITGCISLVRSMEKDNPKAESLLSSVMEAAFGATALTKQLLTFSKGGEPVKRCQYVDNLVRRVCDFCLRGSNVRCTVEIESDSWPVEVDAGQIEQVLGNIVINAKQAMPDGGEISVRVTNEEAVNPEEPDEKRRFLCIAVRDEGGGIPAEVLPKIYDPYFSTKAEGSGLGLTTAYSVVRKHGGFVGCDTEVGQGTTFRIFLPRSDVSPEDVESLPPARPCAGGRVLVMEDDELVRVVAARLIGEAGYDVVAVESGSAAVTAFRDARAQETPFSVAVLDLTVPGGDGGKETMRELIKIDPDARGIVVSGYSDDPVLANYRDYGFAAQLSKPYRAEELLDIIARVVAG